MDVCGCVWILCFACLFLSVCMHVCAGERPQMWPLTRKVVLYGPWPVLQSGARLVDLPGVRDSNAARSNVAASYLKNCSCIW